MPPQEVTIQSTSEGVVFDFPRRPLGKARWLGMLPLLLGASAVWFIADFVSHMSLAGAPPAFRVVAICFMMLFCFPVAKGVGIGLAIVIGRTSITISRDACRVTEIAGFLHWSRNIRLSRIQSLIRSNLRNLNSGNASQANLPEFVRGLGTLQAELCNTKRKFVIMGYPEAWIDPVADHLHQRLAAMGHAATQAECSAEGVFIVSGVNNAPPAQTDIAMKREPGVLEVSIPPGPVRSHISFVLIFGIIWTLGFSVLTFVVLKSWIQGASSPSAVPATLVVLPFLMLGLALVAVGLHHATRRTTMRAERRTLTITQSSWLHSRKRVWNFDELEGISQQRSNVTINDQRLQELRIKPKAGRPQGYLGGRTLAELEWVASSLRVACGITPPPTATSAA